MERYKKYIPHLILNGSLVVILGSMWALSFKYEKPMLETPMEIDSIESHYSEPKPFVNVEPQFEKVKTSLKTFPVQKYIKQAKSKISRIQTFTTEGTASYAVDTSMPVVHPDIKPKKLKFLKPKKYYNNYAHSPSQNGQNQFKQDSYNGQAKPIGAFFFGGSGTAGTDNKNGLLAGLSVTNTKNPELSGSGEETADTWNKRIDADPSPSTFNKLLSYYKDGKITAAVFYTVTEEQMKSKDVKRRYGVANILDDVPSVDSFKILNESFFIEKNQTVFSVIQTNLYAYSSLEKVKYLVMIVKDKSKYSTNDFNQALALMRITLQHAKPVDNDQKNLLAEVNLVVKANSNVAQK